MSEASAPEGEKKPLNFIEEIIAADIAAGKNGGEVRTRFPPEPNGYLHVGHAKAVCLNFGLAAKYGGRCNLRFDDTNPAKEEVEFVEAIKEDVRWLGFDWEDRLFFASDYFETLYEYALRLVDKGLAYVCELSPEAIREHRGSLTEPGANSPYRDRSPEENRALLAKMRAGGFEPGEASLRAKIDMASPNLNLRDPVLYRIVKEPPHHRTGRDWCIYPTYDWAHGQSDSIEGITHSLCTLEFENHRPLYDWFCDKLAIHHPQQIESNRLNLTYTVLSKRKLRRLVEEGQVSGWDDPRMPTLIGMRRRGVTPEALRHFCGRIGATKMPGTVEMALFEHSLREDLNRRALRAMAVLDPIRLVIENYPEDQVESMEAVNNPEDPAAGSRAVPFCRELYIERDDFMEEAPKKFFRLAPEREVRLRYAYIIKCTGVVKDPSGRIVELRATYDPETRSGSGAVQRKVKGTIHWVSARHAIPAELRIYDHLFKVEDPDRVPDGEDFFVNLNPDSLKTLMGCQLEPSLEEAKLGVPYQFERQGYFCLDSKDSAPQALVFNRTVGLRDSWAKAKKKGGGQQPKPQRRQGQPGQGGKKKKMTKAEKKAEKARQKALEQGAGPSGPREERVVRREEGDQRS